MLGFLYGLLERIYPITTMSTTAAPALSDQDLSMITVKDSDPSDSNSIIHIGLNQDMNQDMNQEVLTIEQSEIKSQHLTNPFLCGYRTYRILPSGIRSDQMLNTLKYDGTSDPPTVYLDGNVMDDTIVAKKVSTANGILPSYKGKPVRRIVIDYYHKHFKKCRSARMRGNPIPHMPHVLLLDF
jgi:hypothetical protein